MQTFFRYKSCILNIKSISLHVEHNTFNVGVLGSSPKRITARDYRNVTPFFLLSAYYVIINDLYEQTRFYICFILVHYISLYFMKCATNVIPLCDTKSFKL